MTTLAALTTATINKLYGLGIVERPKEDTLNGAILAAGLSATPDNITGLWKRDSYAEFADGDIIRWAADATGATAIRRSQRGTTAADHADGAVMAKLETGHYARVDVQDSIKEVIRNDLWPHVWSWHQDSLSFLDTDHMYDLDAYVTEVALVYQENIDADERFRPLPVGWWDVERQVDTTVATNKAMLTIHRVYDVDETVFYTAKRRPHVDDLSNLADEIADMIPWAAAAKQLAFKSSQIKNAAHLSQKDTDGGYMRDYRGLMSEFIRMRDNYARTLLSEVREDRRWRGPQRVGKTSWMGWG